VEKKGLSNKDSSNRGIIRAGELEGWQRWTVNDLAAPSGGLTVAQLEALSAAGGEPVASESGVELAGETDTGVVPAAQQLGFPTAAELEAIHQDAWQAGHDAGLETGRQEGQTQGLEQGRAEGLAESRERFVACWAPLEDMAQQFGRQLDIVEAEMADGVLALAVRIAERLVAAHLAVDPHAIEPLLREALAALPSSVGQGRLRVNPADLDVARTFLETERPETAWQWVEDAEVPRGGCLLETPSLRQDLTLPERMRAISRALGLESDGDDVE